MWDGVTMGNKKSELVEVIDKTTCKESTYFIHVRENTYGNQKWTAT